MGGEVVTKFLVLFAGLIACGVCVSPLLFDPAVEEAEEEDVLETDVADDPIFTDRVVADPAVADPAVADPAVADPAVVDPAVADRAVVDADPALVDGPAVVGDPEDDLVYDGDLDGDAGAAVDTMPDSLTIPDEDVPGEDLSDGGAAVVVTDPVVGAPVVGAPLATDPEEVAIPFFVTLPVLLIAILLTGWAMLTPAEALGRPALIAGVCVLIGTALAWALYAGGVSEFAMSGAALAAWICVGLTLLAAWLVIDVLSTPGEDEAVPG